MAKGRIIIGSNWGDEGKGTVVAHYAKNATGKVLNVLTNGGPQRGHTVVKDGEVFTFKHFGSGMCFGADIYFSKDFIVNPMQFVKEYAKLAQKLPMCNIYMHKDCRWTTPFDMMANQIIEENRQKYHQEHGSCGMGIWETIARYSDSVIMDFADFARNFPTNQKTYLKYIRSYYNTKYFDSYTNVGITAKYEMSKLEREIWESDGLLSHFIEDAKFMLNHVKIVSNIPSGYDEYIFENGQGLLLNDDPKNVHTTPSITGIQSVSKQDLYFVDDLTVHYVTRPYLTRHGAGRFDEVNRKNISGDIQDDLMNHRNKFQGEFKYGFLDIKDLKKRIDKDFSLASMPGITNQVLEITHCDEMDRVNEFKNLFENYHTFDKADLNG
jgi:adenylosuccinate synthase